MRRCALALTAGALLGCGGDRAATDPEAATAAVTYHKDIRPIIEANCLGCHVSGGIAPFELDDWSKVDERGGTIVGQVTSGAMPPWPVDDDCHPLRDRASLPEETKKLFAEWADGGHVEGNPADYRAPAKVNQIDVGEPTVVMAPLEAYVSPRDIDDNYRCFLVDGQFAQDTYLTAVDILPGERTTVHHVQIHTFPAESLAGVQAKDAAEEGPGWTCGGTAVPGDYNLYSWRPGARRAAFEPGDGVLVEAGTQIYLQVHYNTQHLAADAEAPPDLTHIAFWTLPDGELPDRIVRRSGLVALPLAVPAGEPHHVISTPWPLSLLATVGPNGTFVPGEIIGQTPHMHQIGTRLSVTRTDADGNDSCMIDVPNWSFEWQMDYFYESSAAVPFSAEDVLTVQCEYDNSPENQGILNGERVVPTDVLWGEGSFDEMCLNYTWIRFERDAYQAALQP